MSAAVVTLICRKHPGLLQSQNEYRASMSANSNLPSAESACKWLFRVFLNPSYPIPCVSATEGVLIGKQTSDEDGSHKQKVSVVVVWARKRWYRGEWGRVSGVIEKWWGVSQITSNGTVFGMRINGAAAIDWDYSMRLILEARKKQLGCQRH